MLRFLFPVLCVLGISHLLSAQPPHYSHALRFDAAALWQNSAQISYTYQFNAKSGPELQFLYKRHRRATSDVFNGDRFSEYIQYRTDSFIVWSHQYLNHPEWRYLGDNRPMKPSPSNLADYTGLIKLGCNFYFPTPKGRLQFMLQPAFQVGRHTYYFISDRTTILFEDREYQQISPPPVEIASIRHRVFYKQTRSMRLQNAWFFGLSYTAGISYWLGNRFFIEARAGVNLTLNPPYEVGVPAPASRLFGHYALNIGYSLGRLRMKCDSPITPG